VKILVFGAGAVGSLLGGFLARAGHEVSFVGRAWHLDCVERDGLRMTGLWGNHLARPFRCYRKAAEISKNGPPFDLILLTVKSFDTEYAAKTAAALMGEETILVSFQNGLGNVEAITAVIPENQYLAGRIITGVELAPGTVEVTVSADDLAVGALPGARPRQDPEEIARLLREADIPARGVDDILAVLWSKVIYNCALNGICSVLEIPYGGILDRPDTKASMERIVHECYAVAARKGVRLHPPSSGAYLSLLKEKLIPSTASHYPSMLRDLKKGKRTEIDALNGAVARFGEALGVPAPENCAVAEAVRRKEGR
jgi:2-dehydropantoate 2-reductase